MSTSALTPLHGLLGKRKADFVATHVSYKLAASDLGYQSFPLWS
jgi:hypothetical protein